jgi:hypothetical protein
MRWLIFGERKKNKSEKKNGLMRDQNGDYFTIFRDESPYRQVEQIQLELSNEMSKV